MKHLGFLFKNKNQKDPTKETGKMSQMVTLNREWHFPGAQNILQAMGSDIRTSCAGPLGSPVHDWSWIPEGLHYTLGW